MNEYLYYYSKEYNEPIHSREVKGLITDPGFKWYKGSFDAEKPHTLHRDCYYEGSEILPQ